MPEPHQIRFVQVPRWVALLAAVAALAFALALFVLSLTVFLVLLPVIAAASALYYLFGRRRAAAARRAGTIEIIEGEYRVIEPERIERDGAPR